MAATGSATLTAGDTTLTVQLAVGPVAPDTTHPQHIRRGTCESRGPVALPLETAGGGFPRADITGTYVYERTFPAVPDSLGVRIVVVHAPGDTPVACGPVEPSSPGEGGASAVSVGPGDGATRQAPGPY